MDLLHDQLDLWFLPLGPKLETDQNEECWQLLSSCLMLVTIEFVVWLDRLVIIEAFVLYGLFIFDLYFNSYSTHKNIHC